MNEHRCVTLVAVLIEVRYLRPDVHWELFCSFKSWKLVDLADGRKRSGSNAVGPRLGSHTCASKCD